MVPDAPHACCQPTDDEDPAIQSHAYVPADQNHNLPTANNAQEHGTDVKLAELAKEGT